MFISTRVAWRAMIEICHLVLGCYDEYKNLEKRDQEGKNAFNCSKWLQSELKSAFAAFAKVKNRKKLGQYSYHQCSFSAR